MIGDLIIAALIVSLILNHIRAEAAEEALREYRSKSKKHKGVK